MRTALVVSALILVACWSTGARASADLHVCVQRITGYEVDFDGAFEHGPIRVPAGTVFVFEGPAFGSASDPQDLSHQAANGVWQSLPEEEVSHRRRLLHDYLDADKRHKPGIVTLSEVQLTKERPCADAPVAAMIAPNWNWTVSPVYGSSDTYFQTYGVVRGATFDTSFDDGADPLSFAAIRGEINGILHGTTGRTIRLPGDH